MFKKIVLGLLLILILGILTAKYFLRTSPEISSGESITVAYTLSKPTVDKVLGVDPFVRDEFLALLRAGKFTELDNNLEFLAVSFDKGEISEFDFGYAIDGFTAIAPDLEPLFLEWITSTGSWSSYLASSRYFNSMAWEWRGNAFGYLVPQENMAKFRAMQLRSKRFLQKAKQNSARDILWYSYMIYLANAIGGESELSLIQEALNTFPKSTEIYKAAIHSQQEKWGGSPQSHQRLVHDYSILIDKGDSERGATILYYEAVEAANEKDYTIAIKQAKKAIEKNPNRIEYYFSLARYLEKQDRNNEALAVLNIVLDYWPVSRKALEARARLLVENEQVKQAKKDIELVLEHSPYYKRANIAAVKIYSSLNKRSRALEVLERAKYFTEHDSEAWNRLAYQARYVLSELELAQSYYKKAIEINQHDVGGHYGLATFYGNEESCQIVEHLHSYFLGCENGSGRTKHWCSSRYKNWAHSAINHLQDHKKCPQIKEYDFSVF